MLLEYYRACRAQQNIWARGCRNCAACSAAACN